MSTTTLETALGLVWRASWQASVLAGIVLLIQLGLGKRLGARARYALWAVVVIRLLLPAAPQSRLSLFNLANPTDTPSRLDRQVSFMDVGSAGVVPQPRAKPQAVGIAVVGSVSSFRWSVGNVLAIAWASGILVLSIHVFISCRRLTRPVRQLAPVEDPAVLNLIESGAASLGLRRCPTVVAGETVVAPAVAGMLRPTLMLPTRVLDRCHPHELRLIVLHELAHLKRHDIAGNWLMTAATVVHWFNPLVWLIAARVRADRELACDEMVLSRSREQDAQVYGRTLLKLIEILSPPRAAQRQLVGILGSSTPMQRRVRMIARFDHRRASAPWIWTVALLGALGCTALTDAVHGDSGAAPARTASAATRPAAGMVEVDHTQSPADLQEALRSVIPEVAFDSIAFNDVVQYLRDVNRVNIVVMWKALEAAGVDRAAPVTLSLRGATLDEVLDRVLRDVGGGTVRLEHTIDRSAIVISTEEDLGSTTETVFYDVSDLMVDPQGQPLTGDAFEQKAQALAKILQDTVAADSWKDNGGTVGSINRFNGKLIVVQTTKNQQQIDHILAKLRENSRIMPATSPSH